MRWAVLAAFLSTGLAFADAQTTGEFSLRPVRPASASPRDRSYVVRTVRPGTEFTDRLEAVNLTDASFELDVAAVDAAVTADGSFAPGAERKAEGAWLEVSPARVRVPARGTVAVQVVVRVPTDATPGDHIAAVVAQKAGTPSGGGVQVVQRVGVRVYLTVEGAGASPAVRSFEFRALRWVGAPTARTFEADVVNTGQLLIEPLGTLALGRGDLRSDVEVAVLGTVPAGESRALRFTVPGELEPGTYDARLRLHDVNGGPEQEQRISFVVGGKANPFVPVGGGDGFPLVPAIVAVLALLGVVALLVRRRYSGRQ